MSSQGSFKSGRECSRVTAEDGYPWKNCTEKCSIVDFESGGFGWWVKECRQLPETQKSKEMNSALEPQKRNWQHWL